MTEHTLGPWSIEQAHFDPWVVAPDGRYVIATVATGGDMSKEGHANARRIVACVNACEGINPEAVAELVEALEGLHQCFWEGRPKRNVKRDYRLLVHHEAASVALAKAKGNPNSIKGGQHEEER